MDPLLINLIDEFTPQINPDIANGIAVKHLKQADEYIDSILANVSKDFPPGLVYVGCERCTPLEEFAEVTKQRNSKRVFDIARSDLYLMRYNFKYNGVDIKPRYIFLPYVGAGGSLVLSGTRYVLSPVLTDKVISIGIKEVFVRLLRAKLRFHRTAHNLFIDGVRETVQVVWSEVYNKNQQMLKMKSPVKAETIMMHYLLCKYGFYESFRLFGNCTPVVGDSGEINTTNYPPDKWVICSSLSIPPKGANKAFYYQPTTTMLAIRREEFTSKVKSMVAGFFYVTDFFPNRVKPEYVDNTRLWKTLMGLILWTDAISEGKLVDDIDKHLLSLDEYIDHLNKVELRDIGYDCPNIYVLFSIMIENFNEWLLKANDTINSMDDKVLTILYDTLQHITRNIFETHFKLKAVTRKKLEVKDIETTFSTNLKVRAIYGITKQHKGVGTLSYSGDNKFFKITSILVPQSSGSGTKKHKERTSLDDPLLRMHSSIAGVGSYLFLPKPDPSGHARVNPHLQLDPKGMVLRNPKHIELLAKVQKMIQHQ